MLTEKQIERILSIGLNPDDFQATKEQTTIADLVEAIGILTDIVLGEVEEDD